MRISDWSSDVCSSDLLMPLWLDFLTTPMAAPETCGLRRLRYGWQALCLTLAASIVAQGELRELVGRLAPAATGVLLAAAVMRSEEHTSELQSLMRISYAVFCLKKKK